MKGNMKKLLTLVSAVLLLMFATMQTSFAQSSDDVYYDPNKDPGTQSNQQNYDQGNENQGNSNQGTSNQGSSNQGNSNENGYNNGSQTDKTDGYGSPADKY